MHPRTQSSRFYVHLVATAVLHLMLILVAIATETIAAWLATFLVSSILGLAAHAYVAVRPVRLDE